MKIWVLAVHTNGEYDSTMDCDYAIVSASDSIRTWLTKLMTFAANLAGAVSSLKDIEVWDSTPTILSRANTEKLIGEAELEQVDEAGGEAVAFTVPKVAWDTALDEFERTEGFVLHASNDTVYWEFHPKHTTVGCETAVIAADRLE